jgi:hypothetical protein
MFRSSWNHHQVAYIINTIKLIEIAIWIHIVVQRVYIIKVVKFVEYCALYYDEKLQYRNIFEILEYTRICI